VDAADWLKREIEVGKTSYGAVRKSARGNGTVERGLAEVCILPNVVAAVDLELFLV